jgi:nucleotide-binding universal stress UspA family protein
MPAMNTICCRLGRYKTSLAAKIGQEPIMYGKILVPVDGSETSILGLNEAIKIAKAQGSQLRLVHIVNELILDYTYSPGVYASNLIESLRKAGRTVLDVAETVAQRQGIKPECVLLESIGGREADFILAQAEEWQADLIVMGTHGRRGFLRVALGSDAEQVVHDATVPVFVVHGKPKTCTRATACAGTVDCYPSIDWNSTQSSAGST